MSKYQSFNAKSGGTQDESVKELFHHSVYNTLVQSQHQLVGFLLPVFTFIPILVLLNKTEKK